jgi:hypothetical protein
VTSYQTRIYYHVTNRTAAMKILNSEGIDPAFSKGKKKVCWYVRVEHVTWAIAHIIAKQQLPMSQVTILKCHIRDRFMHQFLDTTLWYTKHVVKPYEVLNGLDFILREEKRLRAGQDEISEDDLYGHLREES